MESIASSTLPAFDRIRKRNRIRTLRMQRHLVFAALATVLLSSLSPSTDTILGLAVISVLVGFILRSIGRAADAKFGHIWGRVYPEPTATTALDRYVGRLVDMFRLPLRHHDAAREAKVQPLDPYR